MFKFAVFSVLVSTSYACCGLSFTTCCQAYAPPRIIGYERIPLYAKVPVQAPPPPPPAYAVAPAPTIVTSSPIVVQDPVATPPLMVQNYASPVQTIPVQTQPIVQSVMVQEAPAYVAATPSVVVQEMTSRYPITSLAVSPLAASNYGPGIVPGIATNINAVDFNSPIGVPTAKALKLRRSYLKQVKV